MTRIEINASRQYEVWVGRGLLPDIGALTAKIKPACKVLVVTDANVAPLYLDTALTVLSGAGFTPQGYTVSGGEGSKSLTELGNLLEFLAGQGYTRTDLLVALGGGVVGDLTGFAASVYLRGIDFVQIPTTVLAAVDSSVGGKTAINLHAGKNLAGSFYQPLAVFCDPSAFKTLPEHVYADGMAEVIKYGILAAPELFEILETACAPDEEDIVSRCVEIKRRWVEQDEYDRGNRALLNLGHTFGHAIEKASGFDISHGRAVASGLAMAARAAVKLGLCPPQTVVRIERVLERHHLPVRAGFSPETLAAFAQNDKKRTGERISFILPEDIGRCVIQAFSAEKIEEIFEMGA